MTLTIIFVEAALQRVPDEIRSHPQIKHYASKRKKSPEEICLDRAFHHSAMKQLPRNRFLPEKMGRPDIVHNSLLQILETPLNWENNLSVFVHTQEDQLITINPKIRLPKNYTRFIGLIEQLFLEKRAPLEGDPLLIIQKTTLQQFIKKFNPSKTIGFSRIGEPDLLRNVANSTAKTSHPMVIIGAFPRGHFTKDTRRLLNEIYSVDERSLDTWVVAGRFVYDFEWSIGIAQKRIESRQ
jgi:rRNA small subunit pseudouridine methyltransferase Nep1